MPAKNFFFLKEKIIDKTIKLSIYIKHPLHENTTISLIHLVDAQKISWKVAVLLPPRVLARQKIRSKLKPSHKTIFFEYFKKEKIFFNSLRLPFHIFNKKYLILKWYFG